MEIVAIDAVYCQLEVLITVTRDQRCYKLPPPFSPPEIDTTTSYHHHWNLPFPPCRRSTFVITIALRGWPFEDELQSSSSDLQITILVWTTIHLHSSSPPTLHRHHTSALAVLKQRSAISTCNTILIITTLDIGFHHYFFINNFRAPYLYCSSVSVASSPLPTSSFERRV